MAWFHIPLSPCNNSFGNDYQGLLKTAEGLDLTKWLPAINNEYGLDSHKTFRFH